MSVANENNKNTYVADGTVGPYTYNFRIDTDTDLQVIETDTVTGTDLIKTINTHYTVSGVGSSGGGSVTFTSVGVAPALGKRLTLARVVTATQDADIPLNGSVPSSAVELSLDKMAFLAQQQNRSLSHALQTPFTDPAPPAKLAAKEVRANKYLAFDANGDPTYPSTSISGSTPVAAFPATLLDDTNADAVVKTLTDGMTTETVIAPGDLFPIFDVSANAARKITLENIYKGINVLTEDTAPVHSTDFLLEYDVSAATVKKSKFSNWVSNSYLVSTNTLPAGGSQDITTIPAGIRRITIGLINVSLNGTDTILIQLGDSGGIETTSYSGVSTTIANGVSPTVGSYPSGAGFALGPIAAGQAVSGKITLTLLSPGINRWYCDGAVGEVASGVAIFTTTGVKDLSGTLDRIRLTRSGANNFDLGGWDVLCEF